MTARNARQTLRDASRLRVAPAAFVLLGLALLELPAAAQQAAVPAPGGAWVLATRVVPESYRGACPVTLRFEGEIQKGAWGLVEYHWERSDGSRTPAGEIDFPLQGEFRGSPVERVEMAWNVEPAPGEEVWAELVIDSPRTTRSQAARAVARIACSSDTLPDPCAALAEHGPITSLVQQCAERRFREAEAKLSRLVERFERTLEPDPAEPADSVLRQVASRRLAALRASQAAWSRFRKQACEEVYLEFFPGSSAGARRLDCLRELTESRTDYLERRLASEE
jgi:uncharacterized protein YecT (DUF1311 family)